MARRSFRTLFREFQRMRGAEPEGGFVADLEYLENRDLDLSVRLGAMLAFNALGHHDRYAPADSVARRAAQSRRECPSGPDDPVRYRHRAARLV
jgi:hypothetical protein